jgi:chloramphenicol O-acetyltransferase
MEFKEILKEFHGTELNLEKLSSYERWALTFFHNEEEILDPNLDLTLQFDITEADKAYHKKHCNINGSSFTAYLYWCMIHAMKKYPSFFWRAINKKWYHFKNLPLTFPIIVGGNERFNDILLRNVCGMDWREFCANYREAIDNARNKKEGWMSIQFASLNLHKQKKKTGMPLLYFGRRYKENGKLLMPFLIHFDHSTLDPYVIDLFLKDFQKMFTS